MSQRDQQPWPGQTPRRWRRAWLSRWMKGCSQLTLQTGNRTTLSWQQTAGHRVSVISKWKMLGWQSHEYNYTEKHMLSLPLLWRWWWWEKQLTSYGSLRYFVIFIHVTSVPGLIENSTRVGSKTRATKASVPSNISTGSGRALMYACRCWNCYIHIFWCCRLFLLWNSCSPCIFNVLRETGRPCFLTSPQWT